MPKITLTFSLPEEEDEHAAALHGAHWRRVCRELDDWLRSEIKYHNQNKLVPAREKLTELINEWGLEL